MGVHVWDNESQHLAISLAYVCHSLPSSLGDPISANSQRNTVEVTRPRHSMYAIYAYIDPQNHPNVGNIWHTWSVWEV